MPNEQLGRRPCERRLSGQHLISYHSQTVNVRTLIESFSTALFWRHIFRCPHHGAESAHLPGRVIQSQGLILRDRKWLAPDRRSAEFLRRFKIVRRKNSLQAGDPEIENLDIAPGYTLGFEPDVLRLQITMQDAQPVRFVHRRAGLAENSNRLVDRHGPSVLQPLGERMAFQVFHHQIGRGLAACACYPEVSDVDNVRMAQQPDGLRLSPEPLYEFAITCQLGRNDFDGYATAGANVSRAIDRAHSPTAAKLFDLVLSVEQLPRHAIRPEWILSGAGFPRVNDPSLPSSELPEEVLSERRIIKKAVIILVRVDQRLNFALKRRIVLTGARDEFLTLFAGAFRRLVK